jgi:ribosomal protein S18 acetylase RimI-like enzyme
MKRTGGVSVRGRWPGVVVLRAGWAKAVARPWNDETLGASLRFERGNAEFVRECAQTLFELGAPEVMSSPVHPTSMALWLRAGFERHRELILMERSLTRRIPATEPPMITRAVAVDEIAAVDHAAFESEWQIGRLGLEDALGATPRSRLLAAGSPANVFSIIGVSGSVSYLQRIAVHPGAQRQGLGRRMLREAMRWARSSGARTMLLNTQVDNTRAVALYRAEGFEILADRLSVLRATPPVTAPEREGPPST